MKKFLFSLLVLAVAIPVHAQKNKKNTPAEEPQTSAPPADTQFKVQRAIYEQGLRFNDLNVSTQAMHAMIALHPDDRTLLDSLARLYFQRGAWGQCAAVASDVLKDNAENQAMLELRGVSFQSLGMPLEALSDFEKLYPLTKNPYHLYEIATLQFTVRRYGECEASVDRLLKEESIKDKSISLGSGEHRQDVPLAAACLNMRGVLEMEQGRKENAKQFLEAALKIKPEFELAKNNLSLLNKEGGQK